MKEQDPQGPARGHGVVLLGLSGWKQDLSAQPRMETWARAHVFVLPSGDLHRDSQMALTISFPLAFLWIQKPQCEQWAECCSKLLCWHIIWKSFSLSHLLNTWCVLRPHSVSSLVSYQGKEHRNVDQSVWGLKFAVVVASTVFPKACISGISSECVRP